MPKFAFSLLLTLSVLSVLGGVLVAGNAPNRAHPEGMACRDCHLAPEDPARAHALLASQEQLCAGCHRNSLQVSHPSGIAPTMRTGERLPLDWKGEVTCSTCHRIHSDTPGKMRVAERGRRFCTLCHDDAFFDRMRDRGTSLVASGHLHKGADSGTFALDEVSLACMECHTDEAPGFNVRVDERGILRHASSSFNHPVGGEYARAAAFGGYRPAALIKATPLPEGRVSCGSCHLGYTEQHGALTVTMEGSRLCYECHDL